MPNDYTPIQTNADRRAEQIEDVKEAGKALAKGAVRAVGDALDRLIPQGRDELANAIFNGSAYWPGEQPKFLPATEAEQQVGLHDPAQTYSPHTPGAEGPANPYMTGSYEPQAPQSPGGPGGLYLNHTPSPSSSPAREATSGSTYSPTTLTPDQPPVDTSGLYLGQLTQSIANRSQDKDRGRSR